MKISLADTTGMNDPDGKRAVKKTSTLKIDGPWSVGIEYELENLQAKLFSSSEIDKSVWEGKTDGSLRGGNAREYIFKRPLSGDDCVAALENIYSAAKNNMTQFMSLRTSAHIHVNCLDLSIREALLFAAAGVMMENYIYTLEDPYRKWCGFCAKSDEHIGQYIENALEMNGLAKLQIPRYLGINVMALKKFGTIEFRQFSVPATLEQAVSNVNLCISLKKAAIETAEQQDLHNIKPLNIETFKPVLYALYEKLKETHGTYAVESPDTLIKYAESAFHERNEKWTSLTGGQEVVTPTLKKYYEGGFEDFIARNTAATTTQVGVGTVTLTRNFQAEAEAQVEVTLPNETQDDTQPPLYIAPRTPEGTRHLPNLDVLVRTTTEDSLFLDAELTERLRELTTSPLPNVLINPEIPTNTYAVKQVHRNLIHNAGLNYPIWNLLNTLERNEVLSLNGTSITLVVETKTPVITTFSIRVPGGPANWRLTVRSDTAIWKTILLLQAEVTLILQSMLIQRRRLAQAINNDNTPTGPF